ncbi:MAG TPA: hypothetical protein VNF92_12950 [Gemmatimonadaceae bacterium]|nr:hypothetical protein [Gemmatimonadaceae bacterium]
MRLALVAAAFALGTYAFGWWAVAVVGVIWGAMNPGMPRVAVRAALAAAIGWAVLLAAPIAGGAPTIPFARTLAKVMEVPLWGLVAVEFVFPLALAWGGATLGAVLRGDSGARTAAPAPR